ncbi:MAG: hybrid sensor histidine kinase/response regulator [Proteobacteria bacterium]|nr:hybrid sensor histidine kinase/response regulator [Pseudomonadota bacterium]
MTNKRILIVEDEVVVAMEIQSNLERLGYSVIGKVDTGEKAIERAADEKPDIILMDIRLKGDMDGIEAANRIRSNLAVPIVFLTAYAEEDKLERAKLTLPYGYLLKPVQDRDLKVSIEMAVYAAEINAERDQAQEALKKAHAELEQKVVERTEELQHEIDERIQIEESLLIAKQEAELANQAKTVFLANISHELRNPMHQIISYSKFGNEKYNNITDEKRRHYFKQIRKSSDRLMVLLNNLLDLSKLESGKVDYQIKDNDLIDIIDEAISEFQPSLDEKRLAIEMENKKAAGPVCCDSYKIGQVVRNLLANTIKFSSENHKIQINLVDSKLEIDERIIPAVKVSVVDDGVGIPENELNQVFDKFNQSSRTQTGAGGTGLGLAICREIVKAHNGEIWAENNPEGGATFSFVLPYEQDIADV